MWNFAEISAWQVSSAPKHDEFFASDNRSIAHSLVREVTQNSGDAAKSAGEPVDVRFRFRSVDGAAYRERYMGALLPHLEAVSAPPASLDKLAADSIGVLTVEDFGTIGLTGDYINPRASGNFNSFWRRFGQSEKGDAKGGRHGVGKSTVSSASAVRTVFGVTVRQSDDEMLLYGQAALRPHTLAGSEAVYDSYGVFAVNAPPDSPLPFTGADAEAFIELFGLDRGKETGLSLVIPLPTDELTPDTLIDAAIEHCFHQIIAGRLTISVDEVSLTAESIQGIVLARPALARLTEAVALSIEVVKSPPPMLVSAADRRERLGESEFDPEQLKSHRRRWLEGQTVGIKLLVPSIRPRGKPETVGEACVYLKRMEDTSKAAETYVRGRLMVPERRTTGRDCLSLMLAKDGPLSTFLGDSEQPSHTRWVQSKLKELYLAPEHPFKRARNALDDAEGIMVGAKEGQAIPDLLKSFFFAPKTGEPDEAPGTSKPNIPPPAVPALDIRRIDGGFVAERFKDPDDKIGAVKILVRYLVRKGTPKFRRDDFDLDLAPIEILKEAGDADVEIVAAEGCLVLRNVSTGFRLRVRGFDQNRDLFVRAAPVEAHETEVDVEAA